MSDVPGKTPVLVGVGLVSQREEDPVAASEPLALMLRAVAEAGLDCHSADVLGRVERILVPQGRWRYRNPGRAIAEQIGAAGAASVRTKVGILQEALIVDACRRIGSGEIGTALVVGGDSGYRLLRARLAGVEVNDSDQDTDADEVWRPEQELLSKGEREAGLTKNATAYYAMVDSAYRYAHGWTVDEHRDALARLYSHFSEIAAANPHAWRRQPVDAATIRNASPGNRMAAFPYTRLHCTDWSVDQATALLFCSAERAVKLGVPRNRWVFPMGGASSDSMTSLTARARLGSAPGAGIVGLSSLEACGLGVDEVRFLDLYSCFPVSVVIFAEAMHIPAGRELTLTGSMPFAGGPFNNYVLHTIGQLTHKLRAESEGYGLVTSVSGVLTKQAASIWSVTPPGDGYHFLDVTDEVDRQTERTPVVDGYVGDGSVAGYTVLHDAEGPSRGVAIIDTTAGERTIAVTDDRSAAQQMELDEFCGRRVRVDDASFTLAV